MLELAQFSYILPPSAIAHVPAQPRDSSRLLVLDRHTGQLQHHFFNELDQLLPSDSLLVRNVTKVSPARLYGQKTTGGLVEILLTRKLTQTVDTETWQCLTKPGLKVGQVIRFGPQLTATCITNNNRTRNILFNQSG